MKLVFNRPGARDYLERALQRLPKDVEWNWKVNSHEEEALTWLITVSIGIVVFAIPRTQDLLGELPIEWIPWSLWPFVACAVLGCVGKVLFVHLISRDTISAHKRWAELLQLPLRTDLSDPDFWSRVMELDSGRQTTVNRDTGSVSAGEVTTERWTIYVQSRITNVVILLSLALFLFGLVWSPAALVQWASLR